MDNKVDKGVSILERLLKLARKYSFWDWVETLSILFILGSMILGFTHPEKILDFFQEAATEKHTELMEERRMNNSEIQKVADKLLYTFDADRAVLIECHNGASNNSGVPYLRTSCTFEALDDGVMPVADQYQNVNISLMPFLDYLYTEKYWVGNTVDMQPIDKSLSYKMLGNSTEYFAAALIQGSSTPLGYLILSFDESKKPEDLDRLKEEMERAAIKVAVLLEVRKS